MKINNLKEQREKIGLTQVEVAKKANIPVRSYQYIETSERLPNVQAAMRIAKVLNSTVDKLF